MHLHIGLFCALVRLHHLRLCGKHTVKNTIRPSRIYTKHLMNSSQSYTQNTRWQSCARCVLYICIHAALHTDPAAPSLAGFDTLRGTDKYTPLNGSVWLLVRLQFVSVKCASAYICRGASIEATRYINAIRSNLSNLLWFGIASPIAAANAAANATKSSQMPHLGSAAPAPFKCKCEEDRDLIGNLDLVFGSAPSLA